ncbi:hypothetical protein Lal_00015656, partial [Lupinus albus]
SGKGFSKGLSQGRRTGRALDPLSSGCGSIRTLHVDALLPAEVNIVMDGGFSLWRLTVPVKPLSGWLNVFTSFLASSIPTLMEEGRSYVSQFPLIRIRRNEKV